MTAVNKEYEGEASSYDALIVALLPESLQKKQETLYERILQVCSYIASLSDSYAVLLHKKIKGSVV